MIFKLHGVILFVVSILFINGCDKAGNTSSKSLSHSSNSKFFSQNEIPLLKDDPIAKYQWHLVNIGQNSGAQSGGKPGADINISDLWSNYTGRGIHIAIIDTGVQKLHPDLDKNIDTFLSYNYETNSKDPTPTGKEDTPTHGTACAGIAAAIGWNNIGIRGVAPDAKIVGLNVFGNPTTEVFANALSKNSDIVDIYSNSWGLTSISKNGFSQEEMDSIADGVTYGRDGLGSIYLFASGNSRIERHNGNYYQEQNSKNVISVASVNADDDIASYSVPGANVLIAGYGGEFGELKPAIITTDLVGQKDGYDNKNEHMDIKENIAYDYTYLMNGTSAATPVVAGIVALMLEAAQSVSNKLTYRDIKYILATTAKKVNLKSPSWQQNSAGHYVSHDFGFGIVDAKSAVERAINFQTLGKEVVSKIYEEVIYREFTSSYTSTINIQKSDANYVNKIEFIDVYVDIVHPKPSNLDIYLVSPSGTLSILAQSNDLLSAGFYENWRFGTVQHLDESSEGDWKLMIRNLEPSDKALFRNWRIRFSGR